jgi:hypothetical protein
VTLPAVRGNETEILQLLGLPPTHIHSKALLLLADRYGLDPLLKEIVVIPGKGPFVGVKGAVSVALRSGLLDGIEADDCWENETHHCVRCIVWRKDMGHPAAKVIGRVGKHEKKDWPLEIARARAVRAALSYAFNIHDDYGESEDNWAPPPDDETASNGQATVIPATPPNEEVTKPAAAPRRARRVNKNTGEVVVDVPAGPAPNAAALGDAEPATVLVGGHSPAQKLAMAARNAGIDDDATRHDVVRAATGGAATRGLEVEDDQYDRVLAAFDGLADGSVELRYDPDGSPRLFRVKR